MNNGLYDPALPLGLGLAGMIVAVVFGWVISGFATDQRDRHPVTGKLNTQRRRYGYIIAGQIQLYTIVTILLCTYGPRTIVDFVLELPHSVAMSCFLGALTVLLVFSPFYAAKSALGVYKNPVSAAYKSRGMYCPTVCRRNNENRLVEAMSITLYDTPYYFLG